MTEREKWHASLTDDRIIDAVRRFNRTLDNPGFCIECGGEVDGVEPDAAEHECEHCGENAVYGASDLLMIIA